MQNSNIEWTDHTFNPWWGCQRVSPGCEHCYAETLAHRYNFRVWGPAKTTERREMSANYWKQPIKWNKLAQVSGRKRVFCASMADVFEDHPQLEWPRTNLWGLIETTPNLDWLLLTKRPQNILRMLPTTWNGRTPDNVWLGTSCEDQQRADERIPHLLRVPAKVRFLSCEPLLGPIELPWCKWCGGWCCQDCYEPEDEAIHWVICGGESGTGARPMHPDWARSLRDQCQAAGVAYHFKQWGEYGPWPEDKPFNERAKVFQWQRTEWNDQSDHWTIRYENHYHLGKHAAGRLLDGREWNELPI